MEGLAKAKKHQMMEVQENYEHKIITIEQGSIGFTRPYKEKYRIPMAKYEFC